ncbi:MAG TPA: FAD-binding oxidoreductase [Pelomicrobium sp.]|nr:FAD-binding oxidoreductase [Pelomicrobium sp.]
MGGPGVKAAAFADRLRAIVGAAGLLTDPADTAAYLEDWRGRYRGEAEAVVRPASTEQVAAVVAACAEEGVAVVPQGGNTGLCGGSVPVAGRRQIVLSLARMNRIRELDAANNTLTVEAGVVLQAIQEAAAAADRLFPLSLGAEGSCQIGGNLSTNAGGEAVLRYGNTRDLVLGLEVVLPDGRVWDGLRGLRKDNTGYDLKQLFIGAEGTLGVITAAVLKLFPRPTATATAFLGVDDPATAVALLSVLRGAVGDRLTGFELMSRVCLELVLRHIPGTADPLGDAHPWYVLVELSDSGESAALAERLMSALEPAMEQGRVRDAVLAQSEAQGHALWRLRDGMAEAQKEEGISIKHDVSVPVSRMARFIDEASEALKAAFPGVRIVAFGHIGDGNVHYNVSMADPGQNAAFIQDSAPVNHVVYEVVAALGGSISAEHGLGQLKREEITRYKAPLELELMRAIKRTLDPQDLMNPGKVI